ncbi:hypothetical protein CR513_43089, partial [Mucuna pruriens]
MFTLSIKTNKAKCLKASIKDEVWCWHMRFGHLNFGALKTLGDEKMVKGMSHINHPNQLCETCLLGKHARKKESGYVIKALRSDRGGEFTSKEFNEFYEKNVICCPPTIPRTPQQNGVLERKKNRIILNMARCMLKAKSIEPLTFDKVMEDKRWRQAMEEKIKAIKKNDTW